jgi:hypothetical protein
MLLFAHDFHGIGYKAVSALVIVCIATFKTFGLKSFDKFHVSGAYFGDQHFRAQGGNAHFTRVGCSEGFGAKAGECGNSRNSEDKFFHRRSSFSNVPQRWEDHCGISKVGDQT